MVEALFDELLTEPVLPKLEELEELDEFADVEPEVVDVAASDVVVEVDAYASARCSPRPPAARVVASITPAVQRRVVDRARLVRRLVMQGTLLGQPSPILWVGCGPPMTVGAAG